jgi:hypothetical protein
VGPTLSIGPLPRPHVVTLNDVPLPLALLGLGERIEGLKDPEIRIGDHCTAMIAAR